MKKIKPILCIILPLFSLSLFSCNQEKEDINNGNNGTTDVITKALKIMRLIEGSIDEPSLYVKSKNTWEFILFLIIVFY